MIIYYDKLGNPTVYSDGGNTLFFFDGRAAAHVVEGVVYSNLGLQIGWLSNGWIRDLDGSAAFFAEGAFGVGPSIPLRHPAPIREDKLPFSIPIIKKNLIERPIDKVTWSPLSGESFFGLR